MPAGATNNHPAWHSTGDVAVLGTGIALPGNALSTEQLLERVLPLAAGLPTHMVRQIAQCLLIGSRHVSRSFDLRIESPAVGRRNPELASRALSVALKEAGIEARDLGYLIGHTATPAQPLPSNISLVADLLGYGGPHIELRQACTGFANALMIAFGLLADPHARPVAIVGSETGSLFFDPAWAVAERDQLVNLVQMGDGAAAIVLAPSAVRSNRLRNAWFGAMGLGKLPALEMRAGGSDCVSAGREPLSFSHDYDAIAKSGLGLFEAGLAAAATQSVTPDNVDWIIPHQVSGRIGQHLARHLNLPLQKFFVNADRVGNTGSAAIWLALAQLRSRQLAAGARVLVLGAEATKFMHGGFVYEHG
jgi:3-oxoacyl-[acyl-carrier-protein] synthase III